ncbi:hypothetical protein BGZ46_010475 [Entomortierella lignicola]|nr:hypothetical protein BGZ46_010475 [Entomortierella lignicola]
MSASPPPSSSNGNGGGVALSASDRRERNKAASAKYRAKKHHQSGEMRTQISALQDHNNVLVRQLEECRAENAQLKNQVEKLKGRLVAEKVLKRLREVGREKKRRNSGNAGHSTSKASAHDLSMTDSDDDDDVVNAVAAANQDIEDEEEEEEEEERRHNEKSNSRRKIARTDRHSDEDYREV